MESPKLGVLLVDDHEPFRRFLLSHLKSKAELQVVGQASDGADAVRQAEKLKPDLILLDLGLPVLNGFEAARQIRRVAPQSKIIFVTGESSTEAVQEAFTLGAMGYVAKMRAGRDILPAIEMVLAGRKFVSSHL